MRIFIISLLFAFSNSLTEKQQNELLWAKLKNYQNFTGITDEKMIAIWEKSLEIESGAQQGE